MKIRATFFLFTLCFYSLFCCSLTLATQANRDQLIAKAEWKLKKTGPTTSFLLNKKKYWVKSLDQTKKTISYPIKRILVNFIVPKRIYKTTPTYGHTLLSQEAARLATFNEAGVVVPIVLAQTDDFLILSNLGPTIEKAVLNAPIDERYALLKKAAHGIQQLHAKGLAHGRPMIKDMTFTAEGNVGFLDLGEIPPETTPIAESQARDWLAFLFSALPYLDERPTQQQALISLILSHLTPAQTAAIKDVLDDLDFVYVLAGFAQRNGIRIGKDGHRAFQLFTLLKVQLSS